VEDGSDDHGNDEEERQVLAQGPIEKVLPHRSIWKEWDQIVETPKGPPGQRGQTHHPETKVCYQRYVVPNSRAQIKTSVTSAGM